MKVPRWLKILLGVAAGGAVVGLVRASSGSGDDLDQDAETEQHLDTSDVNALHLASPAYEAALQVKRLRPQTRFASGRRDRRGQANAMAVNGAAVAHAHEVTIPLGMIAYVQGDSSLGVKAVHSASSTRSALVQVLQDLDSFASQQEVAEAMYRFFATQSDAALALLTDHLGGEGIDFKLEYDPDGNLDTDARDEIKAIVSSQPGFKRFLSTEAGQDRWHAGFHAPAVGVA